MLHRIAACLILLFTLSPISNSNSQEVLFDFQDAEQLKSIVARGIEISIADGRDSNHLKLDSTHEIDWPGITLKPKGGFWDASAYQNMSFEIENLGGHAFEIGLRIDNGDDESKRVTVMTQVLPGEARTVSAAMTSMPWRFSKPLKLVGMHAAPGQQFIDHSKITQAIIFLRQPSQDHQFTIANIRFETPLKRLDANTFLPFIDEFGQFVHEDWPGKTRSKEDLVNRRESEATELSKHPGPTDFNDFGGWKDGPQHGKAKYFQVKNVDGKWWFVDPSGAQFWSHGIDSVSWNFSSTGVEHRENYFKGLPKEGEPGSEFFFKSTWGMGFYGSRIPFRCYNFLAANLSRKYGVGWTEKFSEVSHQRLRSWGVNTMACWSNRTIYLKRKTPYTAFFRAEDCPVLEGAAKRWTRFVDVFDPQFEVAVEEGIKSCSESIGDPWCIGFYVDNELYWGEDHSLATWTLQCPSKQAAKKVFVEMLKERYSSIEKLNEKWKSNYKSWEGLMEQTDTPELPAARADLVDFSKLFAERYFETIKRKLSEQAPGQLYLGCRFMWQNDTAVRAACRHCDVVSFNCYRYSPSDIRLPKGEDKPILVGEFHFGALDRGMFHATKVPARDQKDRASCYRNFVTDALEHQNIVGTHWFQYASEATSGRGDGENYQVGFVDICDTPYTETIEAARIVGYKMYKLRSSK